MNNHSIESYFTICCSASFSSQLSITMKENKLQIQRKKIRSTKQVSIIMKKISYSKYKIGINYNEGNNLFKVQKR